MAASSRPSAPYESKASKLPMHALGENMQELYALLNAYKSPEELTEEFNDDIAKKHRERLKIEARRKIEPNYSASKISAEIKVEEAKPCWREQGKTPKEVQEAEKNYREMILESIEDNLNKDINKEVRERLVEIKRNEQVRLETHIREYNPSILAKIEVIIKNLLEINIPGDFTSDDKTNSVQSNSSIKHVLDSTINGHLLLIYVLKCYEKNTKSDIESRAKFYTCIVNSLFEKGAGQHLSFFQQKELLCRALGILFTNYIGWMGVSSLFADLPLKEKLEQVKLRQENSFLFKLLSSKKIPIEILNEVMAQKIAECEVVSYRLVAKEVIKINMLLDADVTTKLTPAFFNKLIMFQVGDSLNVFIRPLDFYRAHLPSESHMATSSSSSGLAAQVSEPLEKRMKLTLDVLDEMRNLVLQIGKESGEAKEAEAKLQKALSALKTPSLTSGPALFSRGSSSAAPTGLTASLSSLASSSEGTKPLGSSVSFKRGREAV